MRRESITQSLNKIFVEDTCSKKKSGQVNLHVPSKLSPYSQHYVLRTYIQKLLTYVPLYPQRDLKHQIQI